MEMNTMADDVQRKDETDRFTVVPRVKIKKGDVVTPCRPTVSFRLVPTKKRRRAPKEKWE